MSQARLGVLAGLDPGVASARINQYERGTHEPKYAMAQRLAKVLGVPVAYLYCPEDELAKQILAWAAESPGVSTTRKAEKEKTIKLPRSRVR